MSESFQKPLTAAEIESLLRAARDTAGRADFVSNEPLGPGDVQHLQNAGLPESPRTDDSGTPPNSRSQQDVSMEELLFQAEQHLATAMSLGLDIEPTKAARILGTPVAPAAQVAAVPAPPVAPVAPVASAREHPDAPAGVSGGMIPLSVLADVELDVTLELGRAELRIEELLGLREGSVVTLDKQSGEPIDVLANGKLVARGEVIIVNDAYCVRICEVIGQSFQPSLRQAAAE